MMLCSSLLRCVDFAVDDAGMNSTLYRPASYCFVLDNVLHCTVLHCTVHLSLRCIALPAVASQPGDRLTGRYSYSAF